MIPHLTLHLILPPTLLLHLTLHLILLPILLLPLTLHLILLPILSLLLLLIKHPVMNKVINKVQLINPNATKFVREGYCQH